MRTRVVDKLYPKSDGASSSPSRAMYLLEGNSDGPSAAKLVEELAGCIDVLLIAGDHSHEGVRRDVARYGRFVRPGATYGAVGASA